MHMRVIVVVCVEVTATESGREHGAWRLVPLTAPLMEGELPETA
jgi:hypothetical protein